MEKNPDAKSGESLYRYKILEVQHGKTLQLLTEKGRPNHAKICKQKRKGKLSYCFRFL
jgi:translation initiation factor IF-1